MNQKPFIIIIILSALLLTMACNFFDVLLPDDAIYQLFESDHGSIEEQIMTTAFPGSLDGMEEDNYEEGEEVILFGDSPDEVVETENPCPVFQIIEDDVRENPEKMPEVVVWANAEDYPPPDGYTVSYPPHPDSQGMNNTWRIIFLDGGSVSATSTVPVSCATVFILGDYISPAAVSLDGNIIWDGYIYPATEANRPTRFFYYQVPVDPPRPVTLTVTGYAPDENSVAFVPIQFFGFELP